LKSVPTHYLYIKTKIFLKNIKIKGRINELRLSQVRRFNKPLIFSLANSFDAAIVHQIHEIFVNTQKYSAILISENLKTHTSIRSGLEKKAIPYLSQRYFISINYSTLVKIHAFVKKARMVWFYYQNTLDQKYDYFIPKMQIDQFYQQYIIDACKLIEMGNKIILTLKPQVFITDDMASSTQRILTQLIKRAGGLTIGIPHGCIRDIEEYEFETDLLLSWGKIPKNQFMKEYSYNDDRIVITGSLTMDKVQETIDKLQHAKMVNNTIPKKVVILTGVLTSEVYGIIDGERYIESWKKLNEYIHSHPEIQFIIKPHPYIDYIEWYTEFIKRAEVSNVIITQDSNLEELVLSSECVILFQVISTAALVAMMAKTPVVFLNNAIVKSAEYTANDWNSENGLTLITDAAMIRNVLDGIINDVNYRRRVIDNEQLFLNDYLKSTDRKTESRIINTVNAILNNRL
jgi:hypothetical protein